MKLNSLYSYISALVVEKKFNIKHSYRLGKQNYWSGISKTPNFRKDIDCNPIQKA